MKKIMLTILVLTGMSLMSYADQQKINYALWENVLKAYVNNNGRINYAGLKRNRADLDRFIQTQIKDKDISAFTDNEKKAFLINAYNALTMRLIIDHYPLKFGGIRTINWGRPWDIKMRVAGKSLSLGDIEHKILRKWDPIDPRIHFAINCASISCPDMPITYFNPDKLDEQLDYAARHFVNDFQKNRIDRANYIFYHSAIFNWFEEDFLAQHSDKLLYIFEYLNESDKQFILMNRDKIKLKEMKYNWALNEQ